MLYVMEIDMDREENLHPRQHLGEEEDIKPEIVPISQLSSLIHGAHSSAP